MTEIELLFAERDISRGLSRFARIIDSKDWNSLGEVFADDVAFDYGTGIEQRGLAALRNQMSRFLDHCGPTQHLVGSMVIDIADGSAISRAYVQARHQRAGDLAGRIFDSNGEHVDRWEKRRSGWRIVRRDAIWAVHSGDPGLLDASTEDLS
jgi:ketosteroid isomerase-like protein